MSRKEEDSGRRPLLFTFVGNNRQMLQEIRDNLSHLRKTEGDDKSGGSLQAKPELSQSTPNLVDKSAKMTRCRLDYHQRALAEIAESLRPFQTVNSDTSSTSSANSTVNGDSDTKQGLSNPGYDEESLMKLVYNRNLEPTTENINKLKKHIEGRNGSSKITAGLGQYPKVIRKQSFESKYGPSSPAASDTNSVRSDSPGIGNVHQRHLLIENLKPLANGHQTPPPLPPRAPIVPPQTPPRGQTPPPNSQGEIIPGSYPGQGLVTSQPQPAVIQPGHVQNMIKVMSPIQVQRENAANQQALYRTHFIQQQQQQQQQQQSQPQSQMHMTSGTNQIVSQGISPVTSLSRQVYGHNGHNSALMHQIPRGATITHNGTTNTISQTSGLPPRVTVNLPHPKSQISQAPSRGTQTVVHIHGQNHHEHSHLIPSQVAMEHDVTRNLNLMTNHIEQMNIQMANVPAPTSVRAMGATNPPIIMHSVKSKEVQKPVPQQATVPTLPPSNNHATTSNQNYISSVQAQVNGNNAQNIPVLQQQANNNNLRKLQIQLNGQNGLNLLTADQFQALASQQAQIKIHIQNPTSHNPQNHIQSVQNIQQNLPPNYEFYIPRSWPDTPGSTPRSDSPVSRTTNQSPLSVLSTTSSPSTNSDIPDKPPPPYPGRSYTPYGHIQSQGQPPVPPRVPLKPQGTTHTPPPPQYPFYPHPHHMVTVPPGQLPSTKLLQSIPYTNAQPSMNVQSGVTSSQWTENNSERPPPLPPPIQNRQPQSNQPKPHQPQPHQQQSHQQQSHASKPKAKQNNRNNNNEQYSAEIGDDTDTDTVSSDTSAPEQTHRCLSPMPERRPEAKERDKLRRDTKVRNYSPQAFKFYMEQHVENVLKSHDQRQHRRFQLENEMTKVGLSDEAATQMRRMLHQKESNYIRLKRAKMDKLMFDKITTLGVGAFGEVTLVRKRDPKTLYAMKTLRKSDVIKRNQVAHVKAERDILAEADNEWVVKLYYSFQDQYHLYFVMDYVPGGDLMGLLIKMEILDESLARFYIAELVLAIESVHKMGFIHRDIKPDNILIDHDGHIKLTDFGLCTGFRWTHNSKYYQKDGSHARQDSMEVSSCNLDEHCRCEILKPLERRRNRERQRCLAHSLVGTPNYIAPEVLLRQGYSSVCDWWSVGVILYEMLLGHPPFYASTPIETQTKVIHWKQTLKIPSESNLSEESKDLILELLCSAEDRLGVHGAHEVKNHVFFSSIHLDGLRKQAAPFIPTIRYSTDTSNFDPVDPDKLRNSDSEESWKRPDSKLENGKHPEHAFYEFTFRRFFDDGGHPCPLPDPNSPVYV